MAGQRKAPGRSTRHGVRKWVLRKRIVATPQPSRPAITRVSMPYRVRVRNTPADQRGAWATFAKAARIGARMSQAELARRLTIERSTIWRWETGKQKPENAELVAAFARETDVDQDEALAAAGLRPGVTAPIAPTREVDDEEQLILDAPVDNRTKQEWLERLYERRRRDKQQRMEDFGYLIENARRSRSV